MQTVFQEDQRIQKCNQPRLREALRFHPNSPKSVSVRTKAATTITTETRRLSEKSSDLRDLSRPVRLLFGVARVSVELLKFVTAPL